MRLYSYVVKVDKGFAPNPFGGWCTLAACTPNRMGICLREGDWLIGNGDTAHGQRLIYAMRVSEVLEFDPYFHDPRFQRKKPRPRGDWRNRCGDNIYFIGESGRYEQAFTYAHREPHYLEKDTRNPRARVLVSDHFFYFGDRAPDFPAEFGELICEGRGCRRHEGSSMVRAFVGWLEHTYQPGILGKPRDNRPATDVGIC
ncbi:MAG TPA: hypothetical protein VFJ82_06650 [Longimicrobium sp.]|nr:hypothetical protein [Longimicrobium sp.]